MKNLNTWLLYLETLHPKTMDLGLDRIKKVAHKLHLIPFKNFVITVAGTNGKGSCVALTEAILRAAGYRTGTYISPHLLQYNERICINGKTATDNMLCDAFSTIEKVRGDISLTYFEFSTLAALLLFKQAQLDVIVLEVGLGGRLDAVNIIDSDIAIISTIALDHTEWLGNNRESIGYEKAGIMRARKPCISGDLATPHSILYQAKQLMAPLYCQAKDFGYQMLVDKWSWWSSDQTYTNLPIPKIELQNAATVLKAITLLPSILKVNFAAITKGLKNVFIPGRFQIITGNITRIFDVAHNPAAGELLARNLQATKWQGRTLAVIAMLNDKDVLGTVKPLLDKIDAWYVGGLNIPRGSTAESIGHAIRSLEGRNVHEAISVTQAYHQALNSAVAGDRILVFGSFYTVAEILHLGI